MGLKPDNRDDKIQLRIKILEAVRQLADFPPSVKSDIAFRSSTLDSRTNATEETEVLIYFEVI